MMDYRSSSNLASKVGITGLALALFTTAAVAQAMGTSSGDTSGQAAKDAAGTAAGEAGMKTTDPNAGGVAGTGLGGGTLLQNGLGKDMSGTGMSVGGEAGAGLGTSGGGTGSSPGSAGAAPQK